MTAGGDAAGVVSFLVGPTGRWVKRSGGPRQRRTRLTSRSHTDRGGEECCPRVSPSWSRAAIPASARRSSSPLPRKARTSWLTTSCTRSTRPRSLLPPDGLAAARSGWRPTSRAPTTCVGSSRPPSPNSAGWTFRSATRVSKHARRCSRPAKPTSTRLLAGNLKDAFFGAQFAAQQFVAQRNGELIVTISSTHEDSSMPGNIAYCASKGGAKILMGIASWWKSGQRLRCAPHPAPRRRRSKTRRDTYGLDSPALSRSSRALLIAGHGRHPVRFHAHEVQPQPAY